MEDVVQASPELLRRWLKVFGQYQHGLADVLGISDRTLTRWLGGSAAFLRPYQCHDLARAVFPKDPALAAEVATLGGTTLAALGLGAPPLPSPAVAGPLAVGAPPAPLGTSAALLDAVVCAGADLYGYPTSHVRAIVAASLARALELGLTMEAVVKGLAPKPAAGDRRESL